MNALVPVSDQATGLLAAEEKAREYLSAAKVENTKRAYRANQAFTCAGRRPTPYQNRGRLRTRKSFR